MNTPAQNICPRCHASFDCRPDAIHLCHCSKVTLSAEDRRYISKKYTGCLCADCLRDISRNSPPDGPETDKRNFN